MGKTNGWASDFSAHSLKICERPLISRPDQTPRRRFDEFTFGYCLTVHKAQGSQWDKVYLFDESFVFRDDRRRWLYTGVTRASEQITVVV